MSDIAYALERAIKILRDAEGDLPEMYDPIGRIKDVIESLEVLPTCPANEIQERCGELANTLTDIISDIEREVGR
jgi:hypothetical protein